MRAVLQRVCQASVRVNDVLVGEIGPGLLALIGVAAGDTNRDAVFIADKIADLRLFDDDAGRMNRSVLDTGGAVLTVSQFTLLGDARQGRRPSWSDAASPEDAVTRYQQVVNRLTERGITTATGTFQARMQVSLTNDGPVTLLLDSRKLF